MTSSTKIVVLGESGVGKSTLVSTLCKKPVSQHESTVAAAVSIAWHDYRAGSSEQRAEQIELWDIGGAAAHRAASVVFMEGVAGVILVHDLSNSKSESNLGQWLSLVGCTEQRRLAGATLHQSLRSLLADVEASQVPILIVGTKADLAPHRAKQTTSALVGSAAAQLQLDGRRELPAGSSSAMAIARFFDASIDRLRSPLVERRRRVLA